MGSSPTRGTFYNMGGKYIKQINSNFFKKWNSEMSYVLGYITADGCIAVSKDRKKHPFTLNITSVDLKHLYLLRSALKSDHKIGNKSGGKENIAYQLQVRNHILIKDLINLGIRPRKTYNLDYIRVSDKYFPDFVRGFFDGDGSVYIYKVNGVPQIKANFVNPSLDFIKNFNQQLCNNLNILEKNIHKEPPRRKDQKLNTYYIDFYIDDCEKLAKFMYDNNPTLYLPRKRQTFDKWKTINRRHYIKKNYPSKIGWHLNAKLPLQS